MTIREEIAKLMEKGHCESEIVQLIRKDHPITRPHRIRELYGQLMGPEYAAKVKADKEFAKANPIAKPEKPKRFVVEDENGIKKIFKEVSCGLSGYESSGNNGGGIRKMLISLPYVHFLEKPELD